MFYVIKMKDKFLASTSSDKYKLFGEDEIEGIYVKGKPYRVLNFKTVQEALDFINSFKNKKINKNHLIVEGRHETQNPYSIHYGNRTPYEFLTAGEKLIVGLIYELYKEWTHSSYLKNATFTDFVSDCLRGKDESFLVYANYMYMWDYVEEMKEKESVPSLSQYIKDVNSITEKRWTKEEVKESFLMKILKSV